MPTKPSPPLQWPWIFGVSLVVLALISASVFLSIALYAASKAMLGPMPSPAEVGAFTEIFGRVIGPLATIALTLFATTWLALRVRSAPQLHGLLVGLIVAVATLVSDKMLTPPTAPDEWVTIFLAVLVGWLGGSWGQFILRNREAIYQASQAVKGVPRVGMMKALGAQLISPRVGLIALVNQAGEVDSATAWTAAPHPPPPASLGALPLPPEPALLLPGTAPWRTQLLIALTPDERLLVASREKNGFSRADIQNYRTIGEQIALSLENLTLIEQARETGIIQERQRLAGEIHDGLTQGFISIVTQLEMAEAKLEPLPPAPRAELQTLLDQARQTARDNLTAARQLTWAMRPDLQTGTPLAETLTRLAQRWTTTHGTPVTVTTSGEARPLHPDLETALLRTAREALNNIHKHAHARQVTLTLTYLDTLVALDVQDNGVGFDPQALSVPDAGGFGLKSIRTQAERLGGELSVESERGKGTTIAVSLPTV